MEKHPYFLFLVFSLSLACCKPLEAFDPKLSYIGFATRKQIHASSFEWFETLNN